MPTNVNLRQLVKRSALAFCGLPSSGADSDEL
jgi:hypothetical protein